MERAHDLTNLNLVRFLLCLGQREEGKGAAGTGKRGRGGEEIARAAEPEEGQEVQSQSRLIPYQSLYE